MRSFEEVDAITSANEIDEAQDLEEQRQSEFAMRISNYANIALLALKVTCTCPFNCFVVDFGVNCIIGPQHFGIVFNLVTNLSIGIATFSLLSYPFD